MRINLVEYRKYPVNIKFLSFFFFDMLMPCHDLKQRLFAPHEEAAYLWNEEKEEIHAAAAAILCPNRMGLYSGSERGKKKDCNQHPI